MKFIGKIKEMITFQRLYIGLFIILNIINITLLTVPNVITNILLYKVNAFMVIFSFLGNLASLGFLVGLGYILFKKKKGAYVYLLMVTFLISVLLFVLSVSCNYFGMMFCFDNLANLNLKNSGDSAYFFFDTIKNVIKFSVPYFFITTVILSGFYIYWRKRIRKKEIECDTYINRNPKLGLIIMLVCMIMTIGINVTYNKVIEGTWYEYNATPLYEVQSKGLLNHVVSETTGLILPNKKLDNKSKEEVLKQLELLKTDPDGTNEYTGILKDKDLLLIQLESFNNFLIGLEVLIDGEYVEVTPNLNKLVKENIYFSNYYTSTGIGNTSDAEFSVMTGLYPTGSSYAIYKYVDHEYQTLPEMFKEEGYETYSFHANSSIFYTRGKVHTKMYGFDKHYGEEDLKVTKENTVHRWIGDEDLLKQVIDVMNETDSKSFGYAITITNHTPFDMPLTGKESKWFSCKENLLPKKYELSEDRRYNSIFTGYLEYAAYTDYAIGEAINYLKEIGKYDDTAIILYGDHGIDAPIYNMFYEYSHKLRNNINPMIKDGNKNQKLVEYQFVNNIPLIICSENLESKTVDLTRANVTLQSTIANLFGLKQEYYFTIDGLSDKQSIAFSTKSETIYSDGIVMSFASRSKVISGSLGEYTTSSIIDEYKKTRDFNDKVLKYNLLKKTS